MLDIDCFKLYNDGFSHSEGNKILRSVGKILQETVREIDIACRYGGDEFAVILPETAREDARRIAERIRETIAGAAFARLVTASLGVGIYLKGINRHELTSRADMALCQAKRGGKNTVSVCG
jgi:diguanylate cyclase (GGDEF)-like protein